jgi:flagellar protein FlbD
MASKGRGLTVIRVTTMDGRQLMINSDLIETIQSTPDTVITFMDGKKLIVRDSVEDVVNRIIEFRHRVLTWPVNEAEGRS